jgi:hypothetical protein
LEVIALNLAGERLRDLQVVDFQQLALDLYLGVVTESVLGLRNVL